MRGIGFGDGCRELAGVDELKLGSLLGHSPSDFRDTVSDEIDGGRTGEIEVGIAVRVEDVDAFAAYG